MVNQLIRNFLMKLQRKPLRFLQVSGLSFLVNLGMTIFIHEVLGISAEAAFAIALIAVFVMNFYTLRYYVYQGQNRPAGRQFLEYTSSTLGFRGLEYLAFLLFYTWYGYEYRLVLIIVLVCSTIMKFLWYRYIFETRSF
jgi:putative flippase GtrA